MCIIRDMKQGRKINKESFLNPYCSDYICGIVYMHRGGYAIKQNKTNIFGLYIAR